ncbi:MAG: GH1 family beta-glucosidase [Eubacteriales bacterium]|nr:GH1 family beta-glucosidase [Eubacteriales bacterium]
MEFKKDFLWGTATASFQIEGASKKDGRSQTVWDVFCNTPGKVFDGHTGEEACDHYHRMEEDVAIMAKLGIPCYRFSLAWSRILPNGTGEVNQKGIDFYNRLIDCLLQHNIRPFITLFHWDLPWVLQAQGAWENSQSPYWFEEYTTVCAKAFGDRAKDFIPFNEPQCFIGLGNVSGEHAPGLRVPLESSIPMSHHVLKANGLAMNALRKYVKDVRVSYAPCQNPCIPASNSQEDIEAARKAYFDIPEKADNWAWNVTWWSDPVLLGKYPEKGLALYEQYLPKGWQEDMNVIHQKLDYYGQNIYQGRVIKAANNAHGYEDVMLPVGYPKTAIQWPITPDCLYWGPKYLYERYHTPILITENGLSCHDVISLDGKVHDPNREDYIHRYLLAMCKAANDGVDVAGYFYWSLLDNFEWSKGYSDRFGLVYVNYQTQERIIKDSAFWYQSVIASNGKTL